MIDEGGGGAARRRKRLHGGREKKTDGGSLHSGDLNQNIRRRLCRKGGGKGFHQQGVIAESGL